jgi:hypothetical protein
MQIRSLFAVALALALPAFAQGPGFNPGGPGGPGSGGSFSFDSLASDTTNADFTVHRTASGLLYRLAAAPTSVAPPTNVTAIADGLFAGCATLTSADFSATAITEVPADCFAGCPALTSVVLPATCTAIGPNAFAGCTALASVTAPGVTSVGADAFRGCASFSALPTFAEGATLGDYSFAASGLAAANLEGLVPGPGIFAGCTALVTLENAPSALPDALCAGCTSLSFDPSACTAVGQAALAGVPYDTLPVPLDASLSPYAFAADRATAETLLTDPDAECIDQFGLDPTVFLGRALSYDTGNGVARVEAADLVEWLFAQTLSPISAIDQPASYATADLETWLADPGNLSAYTSADLTVSGDTFLYTPPAETVTSVHVAVEGATTLGDSETAADWSPDLLSLDEETSTSDLLVYTTTNSPAFARLAFTRAW